MSGSAPSTLLQDALASHRRGAFAEAAARYTEVLRADPANADAYYYLAMISCQHGRFAEGVELTRKSLAIDPQQSRAHVLLGRALSGAGQPQAALASFDRAIALAPELAQGHGNRANVLSDLGRTAEAIDSYDRALLLAPESVEDWFNRGLALQATGRNEDAVSSFDRAIALRPGYTQAHFWRAKVLSTLGRLDEAYRGVDKVLTMAPHDVDALVLHGSVLNALDRPQQALASLDRALALAPKRVDALVLHGVALAALGRAQDALASFDRALALNPVDVNALYNRACAVSGLGQHAQALAGFERVLRLAPDHPGALDRCGALFQDLNRPAEALDCYEKILTLKPDDLDALINCGTVLQDLDRPADALVCYDRILAVRPDHAPAHFNRGLIRLQAGDFAGGWPEYEWRSRLVSFDLPSRDLQAPAWDGTWSIAGKTILLVGEQGVGDTLQMMRYAPLIARTGAKVVLAVQPPLKDLLSLVEGVAAVPAAREPMPALDGHCALMSLPFVFRTEMAGIPDNIPYVAAPPSRVSHWRDRLPPRRDARVGVVWSGSPKHPRDYSRSLTLAQFTPALALQNVTYLCLNPGIGARDVAALNAMPNVTHVAAEFRDFSDTAAVVDCLDLVITVDTAVAHLAGAMGKPVWIMLPLGSDWRWMREREDSPWYRSARLFRSSQVGEWSAVVDRVRDELTVFSHASR